MDASSTYLSTLASPSGKKSRMLISSEGIALDAFDSVVALDEDDKEDGLEDGFADGFE
jgi:hypothetical protein